MSCEHTDPFCGFMPFSEHKELQWRSVPREMATNIMTIYSENVIKALPGLFVIYYNIKVYGNYYFITAVTFSMKHNSLFYYTEWKLIKLLIKCIVIVVY